jgi:hypothetical protein
MSTPCNCIGIIYPLLSMFLTIFGHRINRKQTKIYLIRPKSFKRKRDGEQKNPLVLGHLLITSPLIPS